MARTGSAERKTAETSVRVSLELDSEGKTEVATGVGFLDPAVKRDEGGKVGPHLLFGRLRTHLSDPILRA
jgi:hypothetical protein